MGAPLMRESNIRSYFVRKVKAHGGEVRKLKWIGRAHAPDECVLAPGKHPLVELKRPGEVPRPGQLREHTRLRKAGFEVYVLATYEDVDRFIQRVFTC